MKTENDSAMTNGRHACPEAEQLAAYMDGVLSLTERRQIEQHAADCDDCRMVLGETAAYLLQAGAGHSHDRSGSSRTGRRAIAVAATLAAAAGLVLLIRVGLPILFGGPRATGARSPQLATLAAAVAGEPTRLVEGRLPAFAYGPRPPVTRGSTVAGPSAEVRMAAAGIEKEAQGDNALERRVDLGIALLTVGELDRAVDTLEDATRQGGGPDAFNDLAVAYLTRAVRTGRAGDLPPALAATERALQLRPGNEPALFNKALILEASSRLPEAQRAADEYLRLDPSSSWAEELRARLRR